MTRSAEYWKRRAEANMDAVQRGAEQRLARLGRAYHQAAQELEGEVQRILGTYAKRFDLTPEEAAAALREPADEESRAPRQPGGSAGKSHPGAAERAGGTAGTGDCRPAGMDGL